MEPDEAVQLLLRVSGESNDGGDGFAKSVAKELSYLPVAINLAATLSRKLGVDFEVLLGYLQTGKDDVRPILGMKILSPNASHVIKQICPGRFSGRDKKKMVQTADYGAETVQILSEPWRHYPGRTKALLIESLKKVSAEFEITDATGIS